MVQPLKGGQPRLVTDAVNEPWPNVPDRSAFAPCTACWKVPCERCVREGLTQSCPHNQRGEASIDIAKLKQIYGRSTKDIQLVDVLA